MSTPITLDNIDQRMALRSLGLGMIAGMRSWTAPMAVALSYDRAPADAAWKRWPLFSSKGARLAWTTLGVLEYVADKWARTIPRIQLKPQMTHIDGGITGRTGVATLAAAALGTEYKQDNSVAISTAIGMGSAVVGNLLFYYLRKALVSKTKLHDFTIAMIEDEVAVAMAIAVARS